MVIACHPTFAKLHRPAGFSHEKKKKERHMP
jgi:hypothetical protein